LKIQLTTNIKSDFDPEKNEVMMTILMLTEWLGMNWK